VPPVFRIIHTGSLVLYLQHFCTYPTFYTIFGRNGRFTLLIDDIHDAWSIVVTVIGRHKSTNYKHKCCDFMQRRLYDCSHYHSRNLPQWKITWRSHWEYTGSLSSTVVHIDTTLKLHRIRLHICSMYINLADVYNVEWV